MVALLHALFFKTDEKDENPKPLHRTKECKKSLFWMAMNWYYERRHMNETVPL